VAPWIGPATRVIDLRGRTVVPGLADAHLHLTSLGARRLGVDLAGAGSIADVRERVRRAVAGRPRSEWILGGGWDQNRWGASGFPTASDLDGVSPEHPVVLHRIDGHALWANSRAMQLAGVDAGTRAPAGGEVIRRDGKPTGVFIDNAMELIDAKVPSLTPAQVRSSLLSAQWECLAAGLTQVHDMGVSRAELEALRELDRRGELRLRVYALLDGGDPALPALLRAGRIAGSRLTVRGVKLFVDGALGSRGALLLAPYSDDPGNSGLFVTRPEVLEARIRAAGRAGFQVATHAIGDRANRIVLELYERVLGPGARAARPRVEHAQVLAPEDLGRFSRSGIIASMQPTHATSDGPWAGKRLGTARLDGAYAWRSLLASGAVIAAGSDAPVEEVSPVAGLQAAIARPGWPPAQRMAPLEALAAFTVGAAYASFREHEAGRVAPGYLADLTVLDRSPLTAGARVELTIIAGSVERAPR
jgi:predicted amidohydrolase YtcJ